MLKTLFFSFLILPFFGFAQFVNSSAENYKAFYYENGKISSEGILIAGKPDGYWITYYQNELRKSEGNRLNFKLDGIWKFYDAKGNIENKITYVEDKKTGAYQYFDDSCYLVEEENYKADVLDGVSKTFYADSSNAIIKSTIPYVDGRREGIGYTYNRSGDITGIITYKKNFIVSNEKINRVDDNNLKTGVWKSYYDNNRLQKEERYKRGKLNGYVKNYNENGQLESATLYLNGEEQTDEENSADFDINTVYFSDGSIKSTTVYNKAGKKDGFSTTFNEKGEVVSTEVYKNGYLLSSGITDEKGLKQGDWEEYYLTGKLKSKGAFLNGNKYGNWEYYFSTGKTEQKGVYDKTGKITGEWNWFYENGNLLRREEFRKGIEDGQLEEYAIDGALITKGEFFDGEKEGEWFYELNDHQEKGKYRYGLRNGLWIFKFPEGKKSFEGSFVDGNPEGKHRYYNEDGRLIKEENYSYGVKDGKWKWYDNFGNESYTVTYKDGVETKVDGQKIKLPEQENN